jgi:hypothetical protein
MLLVIWGKEQPEHTATSWHDGQIAHGEYAPEHDPARSLRGALATKQSIARRTRPWIASLTERHFAPSRWLAMTVDDIDMIRTSRSLN